MLKSKVGVLVFSVLILFALYFIINQSHQLNGNNEENIVKAIHSFDGYEDQDSIEIVKIIDSKKDRTVAFLYGSNPGYIHFIKNNSGNYQVSEMESHSGEALSTFKVQLVDKIGINNLLVVTNNDNPVTKMKVQIIGETTIERNFDVGEKTASLIKFKDMPKQKDSGFEFNYEYFDKNGKQISEGDLED
ncbi:hypothetical protein HPK19_00065 [Arthrobacter citreus]|nr:hypothetical protein HPK19_00065 [Arthrobacter citreus]